MAKKTNAKKTNEGNLYLRFDWEYYWVDHQPFLLSRGYRLRPRYNPDWVPSWTQSTKRPYQCEDSIHNRYSNILDAVRIEDNQVVVLKKVRTWTDEIPVNLYLSSAEMCSDPRNCVVSILDVILLPEDDEYALLVMPLLHPFYSPPFAYRIEVVEALRQFLQCVEFMHANYIAHRDVCWLNLLMDSTQVIPKGFHPQRMWSTDGIRYGFKWKHRSSVGPVKYHIIDFGLSTWVRYRGQSIMSTGVVGQNKTVPELSDTVPYNPFKVDIYQLGGVLNELCDTYTGFLDMFIPLATEMTLKEPKKRPTASQALQIFESIVSKMSERDQMTRIRRPSDTLRNRFCFWRSRLPNL